LSRRFRSLCGHQPTRRKKEAIAESDCIYSLFYSRITAQYSIGFSISVCFFFFFGSFLFLAQLLIYSLKFSKNQTDKYAWYHLCLWKIKGDNRQREKEWSKITISYTAPLQIYVLNQKFQNP